MKTIKFKKKSSVGDTEHIFVTPIYDEGGNMGYAVEILTLTKHPEMYKHDYILRLFRGYAAIAQSNICSESTLREILAAIDEIKKSRKAIEE